LLIPISVEWQFWQMCWKMAFPETGSPPDFAANAAGRGGHQQSRKNYATDHESIPFINFVSRLDAI
jgi:hypothetical protein